LSHEFQICFVDRQAGTKTDERQETPAAAPWLDAINACVALLQNLGMAMSAKADAPDRAMSSPLFHKNESGEMFIKIPPLAHDSIGKLAQGLALLAEAFKT